MIWNVKDRLTLFAGIAMTAVFLVWFFLPDHLLQRFGKVDDAGAYGDIFGSVNALFTSLAFALLIYTALMQREELKLQREELRLTRDELARAAKSQAELVELTMENNRFQKTIRLTQTRPEMMVARAHSSGVPGSGDHSGYLLLKPRTNDLRILDVSATNHQDIKFNKIFFKEKYLNETIPQGKEVELTFKTNKSFYDMAIDFGFILSLEDIDGFQQYDQLIEYKHALGGFFARTPVPRRTK